MEPQKRLLTLKEVASELRCSKAHVSNVVNGRVRGVARLTHIAVGRRKLVRRKVWVAQWWEDGGRRSKVLGKCSEISKSQADAMMASILQPLNKSSGQITQPRYAFSEFVEDVFLPVHRRKWKESTCSTSEHTIRRHLLPTLGDRRLSEIGREELQLLLDSKARTHSASMVAHLRWHLSVIFRMALSDGAIAVNPSPGLFTPTCRPEKPRLVMSVSEIQLALSVLPLRERLMFRMAVFAGMRLGEILALRVGNVEDGVVHIEQRVYQGKLDSPKKPEGQADRADDRPPARHGRRPARLV